MGLKSLLRVVLINDFNFGSNETVTKDGLMSNYYFLLKNTNRNSDNPSNPNNNEDYENQKIP